MAHFKSGAGQVKAPFGKNVYLRSTVGCKFESFTFAASTLPSITIDGVPGQKILQPGTILAKITAGSEAGKVGPFQAAGTKEIQTLTGGGTISGGTYTITFGGQTTAPITWNANAAAVQSALEALSSVGVGNVVVTGGPVSTTPLSITFQGVLGGNVAQITASAASLTGSSPTLTPATTTAGTPGAADGRSDVANIVGINDTFLPWQLIERDVEIAALYEGTVVQAWCLEMQADGTTIPLSNTTADATSSSVPVFRSKRLDIKFA